MTDFVFCKITKIKTDFLMEFSLFTTPPKCIQILPKEQLKIKAIQSMYIQFYIHIFLQISQLPYSFL